MGGSEATRRALQLPSAQLPQLAERARSVAMAGEQTLPVLPGLESLLPGAALRRGSVVSVVSAEGEAGATSLALALLAGASAAGSWLAAVGVPSLGLMAAAELGVVLERLLLVADPGAGQWGTAVATLVDAFDLVLVRPVGRVRSGDARRLTARARERGAVLVQVGGAGAWPEGPDVRLTVRAGRWQGLGRGHGHLLAREVEVVTAGRRAAGRERRVRLWLPAEGGGVAPAAAARTLDDRGHAPSSSSSSSSQVSASVA